MKKLSNFGNTKKGAKKMRKVLSLIGIAALSLVISVGCAKKETAPPQAEQPKQEQQQQQEPQEKPEQPGAAEEMVFVSSSQMPEACNSCHVSENSLKNITNKLEGHPQIEANDIAQCATCHKNEGFPSLAKVAHVQHFQGDQNAFVTSFKGACVHCHKATEEGNINIPGLATEGTTFMDVEVAQVDKAPNGCLDCHKGDYSLSKTIEKIEGHPPVGMEDFNQCYGCHQTEELDLGKLLHKGHLNKDTFKQNYGNSCKNCHQPTDKGIVVKGKNAS